MRGSGGPGRLRRAFGFGAVALLAVLYPFHVHVTRVVTVNLSYGDALIAVVGVLWLLGLLGVRRLPRFTYPVAALLGVAALSVGVTLASGRPYVVPEHSVAEYVKLLGAVAWFAGVFALMARDAVRRTRLFALVSVVVASAVALEAAHEALVLGQSRPTGPFQNPNIFANYLVLNGFLAAYLAGSLQPRRRLLGTLVALPIPLLAAGVVVTASRGSLFGGLVGVAAIPFLHPTPSPRSLVQPVVVLPLALTAVSASYVVRADEFVRERLRNSLGSDAQNADARLERWEAGLDGFREYSLTGLGYGQSQNYVRAAGIDNPYPKLHNTHLTVLSETGAVGLFTFYAVVATVVLQSVRLARRHDAAYAFLGCFLVAILAEGAVTDVLKFRSLWLVAGMAAALSVHHRGEALALRDVPEHVSASLDALRTSIPRIWPS